MNLSSDTFESFSVCGFTYALVGVPGVGRGSSKLVACSLFVTRRGTTDDGCTYFVITIVMSNEIFLPLRFLPKSLCTHILTMPRTVQAFESVGFSHSTRIVRTLGCESRYGPLGYPGTSLHYLQPCIIHRTTAIVLSSPVRSEQHTNSRKITVCDASIAVSGAATTAASPICAN